MINNIESKSSEMAKRVLAHFEKSTNAKKRGRTTKPNQKNYKLVKSAKDPSRKLQPLSMYNDTVNEVTSLGKLDPSLYNTPSVGARSYTQDYNDTYGFNPSQGRWNIAADINPISTEDSLSNVGLMATPNLLPGMLRAGFSAPAGAAALGTRAAAGGAGYLGLNRTADFLRNQANATVRNTSPVRAFSALKDAYKMPFKQMPGALGSSIYRGLTSDIGGAGQYAMTKFNQPINQAAKATPWVGNAARQFAGKYMPAGAANAIGKAVGLGGRVASLGGRTLGGLAGASSSPMGMSLIGDIYNFQDAYRDGRLNNQELLRGTAYENVKEPSFHKALTAFTKADEDKDVARISQHLDNGSGALALGADMVGSTLYDAFSPAAGATMATDLYSGGTGLDYDAARTNLIAQNELNDSLTSKHRFQQGKYKDHYKGRMVDFKKNLPQMPTKPVAGVTGGKE